MAHGADQIMAVVMAGEQQQVAPFQIGEGFVQRCPYGGGDGGDPGHLVQRMRAAPMRIRMIGARQRVVQAGGARFGDARHRLMYEALMGEMGHLDVLSFRVILSSHSVVAYAVTALQTTIKAGETP